MADEKISELTALAQTDGTEELAVNDGGTSRKVALSDLSIAGSQVDSGTLVDARLSANVALLDGGGANQTFTQEPVFQPQAGGNIFTMDPSQVDSDAPGWNFTVGSFDINPNFSRNNVTTNLGWNVTVGGGREDGTDAMIAFALESFFEGDANRSWVEAHLLYESTSGTAIRPWSWTIDRDDPSVHMAAKFHARSFSFNDYDGTQHLNVELQGNKLQLFQEMYVDWASNDLTLFVAREAGGAPANLLSFNASNRLESHYPVTGASNNALSVESDVSDVINLLGTGTEYGIGAGTQGFHIRDQNTDNRVVFVWDGQDEGTLVLRSNSVKIGASNIGAVPRGALDVQGGKNTLLGTPTSDVGDSLMDNGQISLTLDEGNNELNIKAKYSDGTIKSGTVALA